MRSDRARANTPASISSAPGTTASLSPTSATTSSANRSPTPPSDPTPASHRGDFALYAVADQMVWRGAEKERTLNLFVRPTFTPFDDRNLVSFGINGGLALHDPLPGRKDDTFGLGFGFVTAQRRRDRFQRRCRASTTRRLHAEAERRDGVRGDLPVPGHALRADSAGSAICPQHRRRHRRSAQPDRQVGDALIGGCAST